MVEVMYRFEDKWYSHADPESGEHAFSTLEIRLRTYPVVKRTSCGVWIDLFGHGGSASARGSVGSWCRFVRLGTRKQFAHATIADARASLVARRTKEISIHQGRIERANRVLRELDFRFPAEQSAA